MKKLNVLSNGKPLQNPKHQKGVSLIDLLLWGVAVLAIVAAVVGLSSNAFGKRQTQNAITDTAQLVNSTRALFDNSPSFAGATVAALINNSAVPSDMVSGTNIRHAYNGAVTVATTTVGGVANMGLNLTLADVKSESCSEFVRGLADMVDSVSVEGTAVKTVGSPLNVATLGTQCSSSALPDVLLSLNK